MRRTGLRIIKKAHKETKKDDNLPACLKYGYVNRYKFIKKYIFKGDMR